MMEATLTPTMKVIVEAVWPSGSQVVDLGPESVDLCQEAVDLSTAVVSPSSLPPLSTSRPLVLILGLFVTLPIRRLHRRNGMDLDVPCGGVQTGRWCGDMPNGVATTISR
jgi:hypothetical protein